MAPILPQELIDQVIDHLWKDVASLTACALVSHACLASARTHLFHEQRIVGKNAFVLLEGLLVDRPILAQYIRKLSITDPMSVITAQSWTSRIPALVVALPRLTAFEVVGVHHLPFALDAEARAAFARITHVVLADVYFDDLADALALLTAARNARTVCLYRVGWTRAAAPYSVPQVVSEPGPRQSGRPPLCLKSLVLDSWAASTIVKQWLLPSAEQGEIDVRTLMVRWRERDAVDVLDSLLRACGSALERLYVELPTAVDASNKVPTLCHNTNLRALEIDGVVLPGCVTWAATLLEQLRSPRLAQLSIAVLVLRNDALGAFDWTALNTVLTRPAYEHTTLKITVNHALHPDNDAELMRAEVVRQLPLVGKRGKLLVDCS